jgi:hypothetical protein
MRNLIVIFSLIIFLLLPSYGRGNISVLNSLIHERNVDSGQTYDATIYIHNGANYIQEVNIYQTDYLFFFDGTNRYPTAGEMPRSNAEWIIPQSEKINVPPNETYEFNYVINVPSNDSLIGTYWSVYMIEPVPINTKIDSVNNKELTFDINTVVRYAMQIVTSIGNTGSRELTFLDTGLVKEKEKLYLKVHIKNEGERALRPLLWIEIYDNKGNYVGKFEGDKKRTYPGTSVSVKVEIPPFPSGTYQALIVADCGGDDLFGANVNLEIPEIENNQQEETIGE